MKWQPFFDFFIMADTEILFPLTLGKLETQAFVGSVICNFSVPLIFMKWWPFFNFFIMANADIPFLLTLRKQENQTLGVINLKIFCTIDIYEMEAIFHLFHNNEC